MTIHFSTIIVRREDAPPVSVDVGSKGIDEA